MELEKFMKSFFQSFLDTFENTFLKKAWKEISDGKRGVQQNDWRIYINIWLKDVSDEFSFRNLNSLLSMETIDLMLDHAHKICGHPITNDKIPRKELETVFDLPYYLPIGMANSRMASERYNCWSFRSRKTDCIESFRRLLELEDMKVLEVYERLKQYSVYLNKIGCNSFSFKPNAGTSKNIESILVAKHDEVVIVQKQDFRLRERFSDNKNNSLINAHLPKALITSVSKTIVEFEFKEPIYNFAGPVDIIFRPARHAIRYQHRALDLLREQSDIQSYLYPKSLQAVTTTETKTINPIELINDKIAENPEQLRAVRTIISGPNSLVPFIIFGPPGTGKTTTIVESILQLRLQQPESRILVAAGSNAACDTIAERICHWEKSPIFCEHISKTTTYPMLRIFSKEILRRGTEHLSKELAYRSNIQWNNGEHAYPAVKDIHTYGIVITTLSTVGKLVWGDVNKQNYFTHVFIDEVGASSEPEALMGIMGIKNGIDEKSCCVILSGDYKQLGPVIKSFEAEKGGLGLSLMERLLNTSCYAVNENGDYDYSVQARLRRNYRSHSEIVKVYSNLFYNNELIAMNDDKNEKSTSIRSFLPNPLYPIAFQAVNGTMSKDGTSSSSNLLEIDALIAYIQLLLKNRNVQQTDIGIITPYSLQSKLIKKRLSKEMFFDVEVGSVEKFQGREKIIILVSMVRSNSSLGFIKCPRRLNVLLSRPISLLVIIGEPTTLMESQDIKYVINKCKEMKNYLDEEHKISGLEMYPSTRRTVTKRVSLYEYLF